MCVIVGEGKGSGRLEHTDGGVRRANTGVGVDVKCVVAAEGQIARSLAEWVKILNGMCSMILAEVI